MAIDECFYCRRPATTVTKIPAHHPLGRINSDLTVPACQICHDEETEGQQTGIPKRVREHTAPSEQRQLYADLSIAKHLQVLGREFERITKQRIEELEHDDSLHSRLHQTRRRTKTE